MLTPELVERAFAVGGLSSNDNDRRWRGIGVVFDELAVLRQEGIDPNSDRGVLLLGRAVRRELGIKSRNGSTPPPPPASGECPACGAPLPPRGTLTLEEWRREKAQRKRPEMVRELERSRGLRFGLSD